MSKKQELYKWYKVADCYQLKDDMGDILAVIQKEGIHASFRRNYGGRAYQYELRNDAHHSHHNTLKEAKAVALEVLKGA